MLLKSLSRMSRYVMHHKWSKLIIPSFANRYDINIEEAEKNIKDYRSLNDFFTRRLKKDARSIDTSPDAIISPVDGTITQLGVMDENTLIQAKGKNYRLENLLGHDPLRLQKFMGGQYITIYLSPQNYHRIHSPYEGKIEGFTYIPGSLYPVNQLGVKYVRGLFAKNERIITYINTQAGSIAVIKVGAFLVGSVQLLYDETNSNIRNKKRIYMYQKNQPFIKKGEELGYFQFGSTVICLFQKDMIRFTSSVKNNPAIQMGKKIGTIK